MRNKEVAGENSAWISERLWNTSNTLLQPSASRRIFSRTRPMPGTRRVGMDWMKREESSNVGATTVTPLGLLTSLRLKGKLGQNLCHMQGTRSKGLKKSVCV
jgi:hypothetical protein